MKRIRVITAVYIMICLLLSVFSIPAAAESYTAEITASPITVRTGPTRDYDVLTTLKKGTVVTVLSVEDGIAYISFDGKTGYALASHMKKTSSSSSPSSSSTTFESASGTATVTSSSASIYSSADTSSKVIYTAKQGQSFTVTGKNSTWVRLKNGSAVGYILLSKVSLGSSTPAETPKVTAAPTPTGLAKIKQNSVKVYKSDSTSSKVLATVNKDSVYTILYMDDTWVKIENGENIGYALKKYVTVQPGVTATPKPKATASSTASVSSGTEAIGTGTVCVNLLYMYASKDTSSTKLRSLSNGVKVTLYAESGSWALVTYGGTTGYVKCDGLRIKLGEVADAPSITITSTPTPSPSPTSKPTAAPDTSNAIGTGTVCVNLLYIYEKADKSSSKLGSLSSGKKVTLYKESNGWALISCGGKTGYVKSDGLKIKLGAVASATPTAAATLAPISENLSVPAFVNCSSPIYKTASTSASKLKTLAMGSELTVLGYNAQWALVKYGSTKGYMLLAALTKTSDAVLTESMSATAKVTASKAYFYKYASSSSESLGSLSCGTSVTVLACDDTWALVQYKSNKGYCTLSSLSSVQNPTIAQTEETKGVITGSAAMYKYASASSDKIATLSVSASVTILGRSSSWALISTGSKTGYVKTENLANLSSVTLTEDESYLATITTAGTVYKYMFKQSGKAGTVSKGMQVNVLAHDTTWALIEKSGNKGYYPISNLQIQLDEFASPTVKTFTATVIKGTNAYSVARESGTKLAALSVGTEVTVTAYTSKWVRISYSGGSAYVLRAHISNASYTALKSGSSSSSDILKLQKALEDLGYFDGLPAGNYGSLTTNAVSRFQTQIGITATGVADVNTLRVLYGGYAPECSIKSLTLKRGNTGSNVTRLQNRLTYKGYLSAGTDGDFGEITEKAVRLYQSTAGLSETGVADPATLASLFSSSAPKNKTSAISGATQSSTGGGASTGKYSTDPSDDPASGTASDSIETVITWALQQLGKPYIYGTSGPNSYDCSGLTCYCYKKIGVSLGRSAYAQGYGKGTKIETVSEMKRGDIVCMNTLTDSDLSDHVGIYLGGGKFIHASSAAGKVIISSISSGYYNRVFSWARRVV